MNRSVGRALTILTLLAATEEPQSLKGISEALAIPKSSTLMLLRALKQHGFVETDQTGRYSIGLRAFEVGSSYLRDMTPTKAVEGELRRLTETLGVTSHFAVLDGADVVYLAKEEPQDFGVRLASFVGARLPAAETAVGKAQLCQSAAGLDAGDAGFSEDLQRSFERGYAVDDGAVLEGVRCVAAAVFDHSGVCGAIGVSYVARPSMRTSEVAQLVKAAAAAASARLGHPNADGGVA